MSAKQTGLLKLVGTVGDFNLRKTPDGNYSASVKREVDKDKWAKDPSHEGFRQRTAEYRGAVKAASQLRLAMLGLISKVRSYTKFRRLRTAFNTVVKSDKTSLRGECNVTDGNMMSLEGFNFNESQNLYNTLVAGFTTMIDRANGSVEVEFPSFIPAQGIQGVEDYQHFKLVCGACDLDFRNNVSLSDLQQTDYIPGGLTVTAPVRLSLKLPSGSSNAIFVFVGIQFFTEHNGTIYPYGDATNCLAIVKVSQS